MCMHISQIFFSKLQINVSAHLHASCKISAHLDQNCGHCSPSTLDFTLFSCMHAHKMHIFSLKTLRINVSAHLDASCKISAHLDQNCGLCKPKHARFWLIFLRACTKVIYFFRDFGDQCKHPFAQSLENFSTFRSKLRNLEAKSPPRPLLT